MLARELEASAALWTARGALVSAVSTILDTIAQTAELDNVTILGGVDVREATRFVLTTAVGRIELLRAVVLLVTAALAWSISRRRETERATIAWFLTGACAFGGLLCASLVSHAAAQPRNQLAAITLQIGHLVAAALWVGTLVHLLAARARIERATPTALALVAGIVSRFSPLALTGAGLLAISGLNGAWTYLRGSPETLAASPYGLTLLVKLSLVVPLLAAGFVNFRIVRPALLTDRATVAPIAAAVLGRLCRMIELEVTAAVLVVTLAGILGSISPPGPGGQERLTPIQITAVLTPDLPTTRIVDPATWTGNPTRDVNDLRYSEFMHNWSGLVVTLLGLAWLVQARGGRWGQSIGRCWPLALVPFAIFVGIASDPEIWPLGTVSPWHALIDPIVLEHRIGALLILVLVWLGWRDPQRSLRERPLGKPLPLTMIGGSLLLLGHGHSSLGTTAGLTTLINVQHAVIGGLGLFAGTIRWLEIRGLFPSRAARILWPSLVVAVGLAMAFWYREVV
jgi:putative copper export protein